MYWLNVIRNEFRLDKKIVSVGWIWNKEWYVKMIKLIKKMIEKVYI